jgi:hypothetical protein
MEFSAKWGILDVNIHSITTDKPLLIYTLDT